ncbi:Imm40 family immunity protein [Actinoallomurus sp. NPDC052274]|uniref:Imm40 family immunity protein n=1 Tax=Actinoallomurus sp. NPDC052274 TaxID=3155420 RepID=UPI00341F298C
MASERQERLLATLPRWLHERAADLSSEGSAEYAFPASAAQDVFDALIVAGIAVLGGDLWKVDSAGFAPCYESWFSESRNSVDVSERWREFLARIPDDDMYYVTFIA